MKTHCTAQSTLRVHRSDTNGKEVRQGGVCVYVRLIPFAVQ